MTNSSIDQVVNAVLYEGYILYPYRPSSTKNQRQRFPFGRVYPWAYGEAQQGAEPAMVQTECLLHCPSECATLEVSVRFLQPTWREVGMTAAPHAQSLKGEVPGYRPVGELVVGGRVYRSWQEAVEREITIAPLSLGTESSFAISQPFRFGASRTHETLSEDVAGGAVGVLVRRQEAIEGAVEVTISPVSERCSRITVRVLNLTPVPEGALADQEALMLRTFASTHTILCACGGEFISLTDPPDVHRQRVAACKNIGTWPVLVGDEAKGQRDTMLSSPIILYDYPKVAPESNGDFFDSTEIDEMLALRVMTMTDEEKREMGGADALARKLLERTESISPEHWMRMHGTMRDVKAAEAAVSSENPEVSDVRGVPPPSPDVPGSKTGRFPTLETLAREEGPPDTGIKSGDRVRLRPKGRADAFDLLLAGKTAIVEAVEQDLENKIHLAVVLEDDPGKDLGFMRQPGHRFFYGLDEIEVLEEGAT